MATLSEVEAKQWELGAESEVRFDVDFDACVSIVLVRGEGEVNGVELAPGRLYRFGGCSFAVLTWRGATIESRGRAKSAYYAERTTASAVMNAHAFLEDKREKASRAAVLKAVGGVYVTDTEEDVDETKLEEPLGGRGCALLPKGPSLMTPTVEPFAVDDWGPQVRRGRGPRVLVAGGADSGKSTLCATLVAYAARVGREPVFVDLDPSLGDVGVPPGAVGALTISKTSLSVDHGFGGVDNKALAFHFGSVDPSTNVDLYRHLVDRVATAVTTRLATDARADASGLVINTCGWIDGPGLDVLKHIAAAFHVDVVLVLAHDRLYQDLKAAVPSAAVANLPRSGGVTNRDPAYRRRARHKRIHEYFYGPGSHWRACASKKGDLIVSDSGPSSSSGGGNPHAPPPLPGQRIPTPPPDPRRAPPPPSGDGDLPALLAPSSLEVRFRDVKLFKVIAPDVAAVDSMLPVGQGSMLEPLQVVNIPFTSDLGHCVLAVCHPRDDADALDPAAARQAESENNPYQFLLDCAAAGFVVVSSVNLDRSSVTVLAPCSGDLPSNNLVLGSIEWVEGLLS